MIVKLMTAIYSELSQKFQNQDHLAMCIYKFHVITKVSYGIPEISPKFQNQVFSLIWQCIYTN